MSWKLIKECKCYCEKCDKLIKGSMGHCTNCGSNSCPECDFKYYDCYGNHYFAKHTCDRCIPKFGKIVDNKYYCPTCAPEGDTDKYKFKCAIYSFIEDTIDYYRERGEVGFPFYPMSDEEYNDPQNWILHKEKPLHFRNEIRNFYKNFYKLKK